MKKFFVIILSVIALAAASFDASAEGLTKAEKKDALKQARDMAKQGWVSDGDGTLEGNMVELRLKRKEGSEVVIGEASRKKQSVAKKAARVDVITQIAETGAAQLEERIVSEVGNIGEEETDDLLSAFKAIFKKEAEGIAIPFFFATKQEANGFYTERAYYIYDPDKMARAREKAFNEAVQDFESKAELGEKISKFIDDGKK